MTLIQLSGGRLPFEIPLTAETDAVKIVKLSRTANSRIETIQFYTLAEKGD